MTPLGIIIAAVGFIALLKSRRALYRLFLFSIPFSATSVFNVGSENNASGMQAWMYFGALLLLRELAGWLLNWDTRLPLQLVKRGSFLAGFVLVLTASLLMPVYINGRLAIASPFFFDNWSTPLYFSSRNVTSLLYVVFGALVAFSIARRNMDGDEALFTERTYLAAGLLTCALGVAEFSTHLLHLPSPTALFRNNAYLGESAQEEIVQQGILRVTSVAVEPSILVQYLFTVLPLTMPALLRRGKVISRKIDRLSLYLMVLVVLLSTSSLGYVTLFLLPLVCLPVISKLGIKTGKATAYSILSVFVLAGGMGAFYLASPLGRLLLDNVLFSKSSSGSALERMKTITNAWEYFKSYPILGVGWGSVTSHDLVMRILANSGLLGLGAFLLTLLGIGVPLYRGIGNSTDRATSLSRATWFLSGAIMILVSSISGFPVVFGHFWFVLGMAIAASAPSYRGTLRGDDSSAERASNSTRVVLQ